MIRLFVCKTCGRGMAFIPDKQPKFCYADRMDNIEELSREDAQKMMLFRGSNIEIGLDGCAFEFPGDVRFDPLSGQAVEGASGFTLDEFQDMIMGMVHAN